MSEFIVSARKYRPFRFDEVIGQGSITRTLKNAIGSNHLAHAYLFCGPRGVGKTTCARLFAKTINCQNLGPDTEACNECESCQAFNENRSYNIHELDAASNNSVDDIRNLIDQVRVPPQIGRYSIYIIDEVHMLSASAFNAFLKTLEEPPAHAIFVLATTQKEKIIPTILSRCQIFDFNRITVPDIMDHLQEVARQEGISAEAEALNIIAQKAEGAMRDALSIFDQIASYAGREISYARVIESLNVLDYEYYFNMTGAFLKGDIPAVMLLFNEIVERGFDPQNYIVGLTKHFRDLLMSKDPQTLPLLDVTASLARRYQDQTTGAPVDFLYRALDICNECDISYRNSKDQRLHVEVALIRICRLRAQTPAEGKPEAKAPVKQADPPETAGKKPGPPPAAEKPETPDSVRETASPTSPPPPETETKKTAGGNGPAKTYSNHSLSIKNVLNGRAGESHGKENSAEEPAAEPAPEENPAEDLRVNPGDLKKSWLSFAESIREEYPRIYSTLKNQDLEISDEGVIPLRMNNRVQEEDFIRAVKPNLLSHLRKELRNAKITVQTSLVEEEESSQPYTPEEKFEHMAKKNPALKDLKQQFNLDFE